MASKIANGNASTGRRTAATDHGLDPTSWSNHSLPGTEITIGDVSPEDGHESNIYINRLSDNHKDNKNSENNLLREDGNVYLRFTDNTRLLLDILKKSDGPTVEQLLELLAKEVGIPRIADFIIEKASLDESALIVGMVGARLSKLVPGQTSLHSTRTPPSPPPTRPALFSHDQIAAVEARAKERPWRSRPQSMWRMSPYEWVRDNYSEWFGKGLRLSHLSVDPSLYQALRTWRAEHEVPPELDLPVRPRRAGKSAKKLAPKS